MSELARVTKVMEEVLDSNPMGNQLRSEIINVLGCLVFRRSITPRTVATETRSQVMSRLGENYDDLVHICSIWAAKALPNEGVNDDLASGVARVMLIDYDNDEPVPSETELALVLKTKPIFIAWFLLSLTIGGVRNAAKSLN